ncbi:MAG TPA: GNAT family protein [Symbiobacteriaceae bacterium]|nr:GNAT family protein [Symbiobacteriaceae bacterium]
MSELTLQLVTGSDAAEIIAFEQENRAFFARFVPDRGDDYFSLANMARFLAEIEAEQARGECYLYLVRRHDGELVGRVNLVDIQKTPQPSADIGYRIGASHGGHGYGSEAVRLALIQAARHGIGLVRAMTTEENVASQTVLLRNGFAITGRKPKHLDVNGTLCDAVFFERALG